MKSLFKLFKRSSVSTNEFQTIRTYNELDEHRVTLWIALCKCFSNTLVWRTIAESDGSINPGWFILGYRTRPGKQITYHIPISRWEETNFATTRKRAPKHDGHNSQDIINRIMNLK